ncbi:class I SAM-dependent methyltransferase [Actinomadura graeca]|uniref:Class I SAM-dependent methyltransferase n=1 Tax=Actinomadura graeca TaxID=2750812 RepID=A0ABX8QZ03_9ACTN|nr:class I SAM-dependent methyltransferase [Actinomadura graeca]QXJ22662.1 class I SAM-dependent methyltransferase [Actinomadura graeca]
MTEADTRTAYDAVAALYADLFGDVGGHHPLDRALIAGFAELAGDPVADLGCGPGHLTAHLSALGRTAFGLDLSPAMIALARRAHPALRFEEGSLTALALPDGSVGGALVWYSTIHTPPGLLPDVLAEVHRVLAPGGRLLFGFYESPDTVRPFDHKVTRAYRWPLGRLAGLLEQAGLAVEARASREPVETERFGQGRLLARKPPAPRPPAPGPPGPRPPGRAQ